MLFRSPVASFSGRAGGTARTRTLPKATQKSTTIQKAADAMPRRAASAAFFAGMPRRPPVMPQSRGPLPAPFGPQKPQSSWPGICPPAGDFLFLAALADAAAAGPAQAAVFAPLPLAENCGLCGMCSEKAERPRQKQPCPGRPGRDRGFSPALQPWGGSRCKTAPGGFFACLCPARGILRRHLRHNKRDDAKFYRKGVPAWNTKQTLPPTAPG